MRADNVQIIIVLFVSVLTCTSCNTKTVQQQLNVETEIINFSSFKKIEISSMPESIVTDTSYVKLDGSFDDIIFRESNIIKIKNNRIFILDVMLRKLVVFDSTGAGLGKVGSRGQGPGEYLRIHDFCVSDAGDIYLKDGSGGKGETARLFVYNKDFELLSVQQLPFSPNYIQRLNNDNFLFALNSFNKGNNASIQIVLTNDKFKTETAYLQFDEYVDENFILGIGTFTCFDDKILYLRTIDNYVYEFSNEGKPLKTYFFDFGNRDVPNNVRKNIEGNWEELKRYSCIEKIVLINEKYIAGTLFEDHVYKSFIVDRIENCLYVLNRPQKGFHDILWCYENNLVSCIYPGIEDIQSVNLPKDVKDHIDNENFVLCMYKLR